MFAVTLPLTCAALLVEALIGYPGVLYRALGHPATWMGAALNGLDRSLNSPAWSFGRRKAAGVLALLLLLGGTALVTVPFEGLTRFPLGFLFIALVAASLPAQRSLYTHVAAVAEALDRDGVDGGRRAVSMIVGRNPAHLDSAGVARAAIESLAENFSDGVVAPTFWMALGGLPGAALYKAINTADSMIGHRTERYEAFGWASARLDDLVNLPASRLSVSWLLLASAAIGEDWRGLLRCVRRDAGRHRSPNAGWPEAAMAGALGLKLNGPRVYGETLVEDCYMGDGRREVGAADIRRALRLYRIACVIQGLSLAALSLIVRL